MFVPGKVKLYRQARDLLVRGNYRMAKKILEVKNLVKKYAGTDAVAGVSFSIYEGEVVGLLGPNGAGKTTTIDMILGLLDPTEGEVLVFGKNLKEYRSEILQQMNFSAVYAQLPGNLSVWENLYIFALLYGVADPKESVKGFLKNFDLERFRKTRVGFLSSGEQSRVNLAKALLNNPRLLLLDEPTASLDPSTAQIMRGRIKEHVTLNKAAILWTSHDMYEIEAVCDRVLFISHGKILLEGDPRKLPNQYGKKNLEELFISVAREPLSLHPLHA